MLSRFTKWSQWLTFTAWYLHSAPVVLKPWIQISWAAQNSGRIQQLQINLSILASCLVSWMWTYKISVQECNRTFWGPVCGWGPPTHSQKRTQICREFAFASCDIQSCILFFRRCSRLRTKSMTVHTDSIILGEKRFSHSPPQKKPLYFQRRKSLTCWISARHTQLLKPQETSISPVPVQASIPRPGRKPHYPQRDLLSNYTVSSHWVPSP